MSVEQAADIITKFVFVSRERDDLKAKLAQVEADCAAMREALDLANRHLVAVGTSPHHSTLAVISKALATGSGQALLENETSQPEPIKPDPEQSSGPRRS